MEFSHLARCLWAGAIIAPPGGFGTGPRNLRVAGAIADIVMAQVGTTPAVDDFAIVGPPERCIDRLRAIAAVGLDEVAPAYLNGRIAEMERAGKEIIPSLAALPA